MDKDKKEQPKPRPKPAKEKQEKQGEIYYCGICGWVPLSQFPRCHRTK